MQAQQKALVLDQVSKIYGQSKFKKNNQALTMALNSVSLSVDSGEFVAIMGPSGSGKSTLLNCVSTIDAPTSGTIMLGGRNINQLKRKELAEFRQKELGFIFQDFNLLDTLTCYENIALALSIAHVPSAEIQSRVNAAAQTLGIQAILEKYPYQVSGGQKQRVAAARAIVTKPVLILADEPTGALDSKSSKDLLERLNGLNEQGSTILMVTHDPFTASYANRIIFIKDGQIYCQLHRDDFDRKEFFAEIIRVTTELGGDQNAVC